MIAMLNANHKAQRIKTAGTKTSTICKEQNNHIVTRRLQYKKKTYKRKDITTEIHTSRKNELKK